MVNTLGPKGLSPGSTRQLSKVEVPQGVIYEADLPDLIVDLANSYQLTGRRGEQSKDHRAVRRWPPSSRHQRTQNIQAPADQA
jgi:hypothetical protein